MVEGGTITTRLLRCQRQRASAIFYFDTSRHATPPSFSFDIYASVLFAEIFLMPPLIDVFIAARFMSFAR